MLIARRKKRVYTIFTVNDEKIKTRDTMKYLGVTIDAQMSFKDHLRNARLKASKVARMLAGIMPNIGGPKQPRWLLLSSVVYSVILYGAPIWADAICSNPSYGAVCRRVCRTIALRMACAYRTVSDIALSVVAGLPPLDLMARERAEVYREGVIKEEGDFDQGPRRNRWSRKTVEEWQRRWDIADNSRWTHCIIPCVVEWTERRHGLVTFYLTQVLTGHGCFRSYLKRIGVYESAECPTHTHVADRAILVRYKG